MTVEDGSRVVDRSELHSGQSSKASSPDVDIANKFRALLNEQFGEPEIQNTQNAVVREVEEEPVEGELEFRLFSTSTATQKIDIRSPSPLSSAPGFIVTDRPKSYYFADEPSNMVLAQYKAVALAGEDVVARSQTRWAGCALPWKIISASSGPQTDTARPQQTSRGRRRPSKKTRIALRTKRRQKEAKEVLLQKAVEEKEAYLRDKKTSQNRKKQLKRRAKEKAKKVSETDLAPAD